MRAKLQPQCGERKVGQAQRLLPTRIGHGVETQVAACRTDAPPLLLARQLITVAQPFNRENPGLMHRQQATDREMRHSGVIVCKAALEPTLETPQIALRQQGHDPAERLMHPQQRIAPRLGMSGAVAPARIGQIAHRPGERIDRPPPSGPC